MCKGFVKIPRRIYEEKQWNIRRVYSELDAFYDIYASAATRDRTEPDRTKLKRNQLSVSLRSLAEKWIWSYSKVRRFLLALERKGYVSNNFTDNKTIITILDFGYETQGETPPETQGETLLNHSNPDKHRYSDDVSETPPETQGETLPETPTETLSRAYKNDIIISCLNEEDKKKEEYIDSSLRSESTHINSAHASFLVWLSQKCPYISKNYKLLSEEEFEKLKSQYGSQAIEDECENIENRKDKRKNYTNLYRTLLNWLKRDYTNNPTNNEATTHHRYYQNTDHPSNSELVRQAADLMREMEEERRNRQAEIWL